jgi:putative transposase
VIYTTNAIDSLNSMIRHAIKEAQGVPDGRLSEKRSVAGNPGSSPKWMMPLKDWRRAMSRFMMEKPPAY